MRNGTQYLTVLQFDLCGVQGDKLDHYRKGAVPEQQMFPISYVKGCKNIHQCTPGTGELVLVTDYDGICSGLNLAQEGPLRSLKRAQWQLNNKKAHIFTVLKYNCCNMLSTPGLLSCKKDESVFSALSVNGYGSS